MLRTLRLALGTRRGLILLSRNTLAFMGLVAAALQLAAVVWPKALVDRGWLLVMVASCAALYGLITALPPKQVCRRFKHPDFSVQVKIGDLFDEQTHLVIGFNDVFDTEVSDGVVIHRSSVQAQFLHRVYVDDRVRLDADLNRALREFPVIATEQRANKRRGKLKRYPTGTVAVLSREDQQFYCTAYGKMGNDLVIRSSVDLLWESLAQLWGAVYLSGHRQPVSMPVIGSELARVNELDRESLLRVILMSFVARSRQELITKKLVVIIHPRDHGCVNMLEIAAFLRTL